MRTPVEKAIWFIESHLGHDIALDDLAAVGGLTRWQMSRVFSHALGKSVTQYIRERRLTEAARLLARGAGDILAVALEAGYGSHEAFTRAFHDQFGLGPAQLRARGDLGDIALVEPVREDRAVTVELAPPRLLSRGPLLIAGIGRRMPSDDLAGIPAIWQDFHRYLDAIPGRQGSAAYGVVAGMSAEGDSFFYLAGVEVSDLADLDDDLAGIRLPAQRWAAFAHAGHVTTIASTVHAVFEQALPAAGLVAGGMPELLEQYEEQFDPWTGSGGFELWVPVA